MKKWLLILLLMMVPVLGCAEEACPLCGDTSEVCLTDECGAVYCSGTLVSYPAEQTVSFYDVREGTVMIGEGAFRDCTSLQTILLPDSLLIIAEEAFYGCAVLSNLNGLELPSGLYAVGDRAFAGCRSLYDLDLPSSLRFVGDGAFAASGLTDLYLYSKQFVYGLDVIPVNQVTIHMPGEFPSVAILDFVADHVGTELRFDLVEEEW